MIELEQQMILAARKGREEGYQYLMNRYGNQVHLLVAQLVPDIRDVEELTQDAFIRAFEHLSDFNPQRGSFCTWLCHIAYNAALNHMRSQNISLLHFDEELYPPPNVPLWVQDEEEKSHETECLSLLNRAIEHLRPEEHALLHMRYYEGYTLGKIAEIMGVAEMPLANRLQRIRHKLSKLMKNEQDNR